MLKSRRGLLAAGLAVAVVGALGVASTLNAGADQIAGAADATTEFTPPAVLPWGGSPTSVSTGDGGATSKTLRAAGLDAAAPDASGSTTPRGRYAPKGRTAKASDTTDTPPEPLSTDSSSTTYKVNYLYNVGSQMAEADGVYANVTIGRPRLGNYDYHSLAELALQSADGQQIVEVGWTVDRLVNGDEDPHLFVYHWVNRQPSCYNGCGFQPYSKNVFPGSTLPLNTTKRFGIQYYNGAWWIAYDTEWIGYFPEQLWNDQGVTFNRSGLVQAFGEVAGTTSWPCTAMGTGSPPESTDSALLASVAYLNGPTVSLSIRSTTDLYRVAPLSARSFRYGGTGASDC